jgi:hypothetical protein
LESFNQIPVGDHVLTGEKPSPTGSSVND